MQVPVMAQIALVVLATFAVPSSAEDPKKDNKAVKPAAVAPPAANIAKPTAATPAAGTPPRSPNPPRSLQSRGVQSQEPVESLSQRDPRAECREKTARMPEGEAKTMALQKCMQDAAQLRDTLRKLQEAQSRTQQDVIRKMR